MEIDWIELSFAGEAIRAYTSKGAGSSKPPYLFQSERGLFLPGSGTTTTLAKYGVTGGSILPKYQVREGKSIDLTILVDTNFITGLNKLNNMYLSNRVVLSTSINGLGPYLCTPVTDSAELVRHDDNLFSYSFTLKAREVA